MKKIIVALMLLFVLVLSVVSCSCGKEEPSANDTKNSTSVTTTNSKPREPIYDTDDSWGPLIPMT
ncbi:MAG: hypothetical protein IKM34_00110 [Clostridia bacterium]|nr:hypothetical protein [Clostridia bacterium]